MSNVIPNIFDVILEIPFKSIDPKNIVDLSNSQSKLFQFELPLKKQDVIRVEKKFKKYYDSTKKFQAKWIANLPWAKGLMNERGFIQNVKCIVCSSIKSNDKIVGCKWDTLTKHVQDCCVKLVKAWGEKGWNLHCYRLCPFEKYEIVCPKGSQVSLDSSKQTNG